MARSNRRHTRSRQKIPQPTEQCKDMLHFRTALAEYLRSSSESVSESSWFTVRGRHQWALSFHLGLDTRQYSALLLACGLVNTTKTTKGASSVSCSSDAWKENFLKRYGLFDGTKGHCEITEGKVKRKYIIMDDDINEYTTDDFVKMHLFRIGKYKERGMTTKATTQINAGEVPASSITFNHKHRTARRRLFNNINNDFSKYLFDERIDDVMRWVEMTDVYNKTPATNSGKHQADAEVDADHARVGRDNG